MSKPLPRQVTVFGAGGKVGRLVVMELLNRGYTVVAAVHSKSLFKHHEGLKVVKCDIRHEDQVAAALTVGGVGSQAVISALGSWGTTSKDIVSSGIANIVPAMQTAGIRRIISLTGHGAYAAGDQPDWLDRASRYVMNATPIANKVLHDGERHIEILQDSGLDWTVLRSPIMTNNQRTGYRLRDTSPFPWATIPRQAVVQAIASQLDDHTYNGQSPYIVKS